MPIESVRDEIVPLDSATEASPLGELKQKILETYGLEVWGALEAGLAVIASLSLKDRAHPLPLIYEGASGRGKSFVINMCEADRDETRRYLYRLDTFTPKSFVTHAANVGKEDLEGLDLLPKIRDKVLLIKELAPIFRGRDEELRANFAILTAVLDGRGLLSASGAQGTRGYGGRYVFNWLGATTPVPERTDAIMAQLGNRLLRYEITGQEQSEEELVEFAKSYSPRTTEDACRGLVNDAVLAHFSQYPVDSVDPKEIGMSQAAVMELVRYAKLIAHGRVELMYESNGLDFMPGTPEGPQRVILLLMTLTQGLALLCGRREVTAEDLGLVRHVAFSSIPRGRRKILRAVLTSGGQFTSEAAEEYLRISRPTARKMMRELAATGIVTYAEGTGPTPDVVTLAGDWRWLLGLEADSAAESEM